MNVDKVIKRLSKVTHGYNGEPKLSMSARDVGHELHKNRVDKLREFRTKAAELSPIDINGFSLGYRRALIDIVAAYEASIKVEYDPPIRNTKQSVMKALKELFGDLQRANMWTSIPNQAFDHKKPIDLLETKEGRAQIITLINQLEHGCFF